MSIVEQRNASPVHFEPLQLNGATSVCLFQWNRKKVQLTTCAANQLLEENPSLETVYVGHKGYSVASRQRQPAKITSCCPAIQMIAQFWKEHVESFKICHGTTSLYRPHFQKHGLSTRYPEALKPFIGKVRALWTNHAQTVMAKSGYFLEFEQRYDNAKKTDTIAFSFSARPSTTEEFTVGARHGGEWIRELRNFLRELRSKKDIVLTDVEKRTVAELQALIDLMHVVPAMAVKINAGCPDIEHVFSLWTPFVSLEKFIEQMQRRFPDWKNCVALSGYLHSSVLQRIEHEKEQLQKDYEIALNDPVCADHLEFELIGGQKKEPSIPQKRDYPAMTFDQPTRLLLKDVCKLKILTETGCSAHEEYQDSVFECKYADPNSWEVWMVTRRKKGEKDAETIAVAEEKRQMRIEWLRRFGCEDLMKEYVI